MTTRPDSSRAAPAAVPKVTLPGPYSVGTVRAVAIIGLLLPDMSIPGIGGGAPAPSGLLTEAREARSAAR